MPPIWQPPAEWVTPVWDAPAGVHAVCTTRLGGVSKAPYDSLNLGDHVGDDPVLVLGNRARLTHALGVRPVFLNQIHSTIVVDLTAESIDGQAADASATAEPGVACTVMVADCLPVLLACQAGPVVAAAHAGWRGLVGVNGQGVLEQTYEHLCALAKMDKGLNAIKTEAWLGPCIGPGAFEVGAEVRDAFMAADPQASVCFTPGASGKWWADLAGLARQRLHHMGIHRVFGNDSTPQWCTVSQPSRFFSYRRDGVSGRFCASVWRG